MTPDFIRQDETPLFPQVLYNRPVTRSGAGRLLIAGGHSGEISQPTALYELAMASGAGECVVALPDSLIKLLGAAPATTFVASSPSGSLGRDSLGRLLELSEDADAVILGSSLSNNSETAILTERFVREVERPVIAVDEAITLLMPNLSDLTSRPQNLLILTMPQIFKLGDQLGVPIQIQRGGGLINKLQIIAAVTEHMAATVCVYGTEIIITGGTNPPIVTPTDYRLSQYPAVSYALASVLWLQNPKRRREGLVTAAYIAGKISQHIHTNPKPTVAQLARLIRAELDRVDGF